MAVYVVTGATGGLGTAVVRALLAGGHRVAVPFRESARFEALQKAVGQTDALHGEPAVVERVEDAERLMAAAVRWGGALDGVAALAGAYASSGTLEEAPVREWDEMLRQNLQTTYSTCRAALPHLRATRGSLVTCSSHAVATGGAGTAYIAAKAAVEALTRELAVENRARGVRVNAVAPGIIDTPANRAAMPDADTSRWTPPEQIAGVIAFLLSPASAPITGAVVPVHARR